MEIIDSAPHGDEDKIWSKRLIQEKETIASVDFLIIGTISVTNLGISLSIIIWSGVSGD